MDHRTVGVMVCRVPLTNVVGIFYGMISGGYPECGQVLADLGDPFVQAFIDAVDGARDDFAAFKEWQPGWFPSFTARFTANFLHERIWDRLVRVVDGMEGIHIHDVEPTRELHSGTAYSIRIKRHHPGDRISAYPTDASRAFWSNNVVALEGLVHSVSPSGTTGTLISVQLVRRSCPSATARTIRSGRSSSTATPAMYRASLGRRSHPICPRSTSVASSATPRRSPSHEPSSR